MSDHSLIYIHRKISIPRKQPKIINTRQFKHFNVEAYKQDLAKILQNQPQDGDPNILWEDWKRKFLLAADMHAPPVTRRVRSEHAPWLTSEIKKKIYDRDFLKKKSIKTGSTHFFNAYKKARNQLNSLIKSTKAKYYNTYNTKRHQNVEQFLAEYHKALILGPILFLLYVNDLQNCLKSTTCLHVCR